MNYRIKIAEHPEYADALVAMFGTDDVGRISEQDARLFWHYIVPQLKDGHFIGDDREGGLNLEADSRRCP